MPAAPVFASPVIARAEHNATASNTTSSAAKSAPSSHSSAHSNATSSDVPTPTASNQLEHSGVASAGATATLSADTPQGTCTMDNALSQNQQAGWTDSIVNTCCTAATETTCWYRIQAKVSAEEACKIPNCDDLASNDRDRMLGFVPLSSTNGEGKYANTFPILFLSAAIRPSIHVLLFIVAPIGVSLLLLL